MPRNLIEEYPEIRFRPLSDALDDHHHHEDRHYDGQHQEKAPKMGRKWDKFVLLMWKNALLQYRKPLQTFVEIIAPVLFSILLVIIRSLVDPEENFGRHYPPFCPVQLPYICDEVSNSTIQSFLRRDGGSTGYLANLDLVYSPSDNAAIDRSMNMFRLLFRNVQSYPTEKELEEHFLTSEMLNSTFAAIVFDDKLKGGAELPDNTEVNIRFPGELRSSAKVLGQNNWQTNMLFPVYQTPGPRAPNKTFGAAPEYYVEGFLSLQTILTYFLIYGELGATSIDDVRTIINDKGRMPPMVKMQRFPYANWVEDPLLQALESFVGIIIMLSFVYTCINTVKVITTEKEKQLKEAMKIMGLPNWLHWTAWFLKTFVFLLVSIILIVILLKVTWYPNTSYSVFTHANAVVMLLFLFFYMCSTITFCFAISVFFSKANTASTIAGLLWFLSYAPYLFLQNQYATLSLSTKMFASIGSNTAMAYGFQLMLMFEGTGEGIQWGNIFTTNTPDDDLTLGHVMLMLIIDTFLYLFIALYVEAVFPGQYGVPQPWNYLFTASYWTGRPSQAAVQDFAAIPTNDSEYFEKEPNLETGVQIKNLRKVFSNKAAVRNLTLNMYQDQITVLLGHNGAGKTTTMSMLTGMFPPTSGTATVGGHDIITDMDGVRSSLGLCPQHNILFDDLTVREHLIFFAKLKGLEKTDITKEVDNYIELLELVPKANAKSSTLSGGMKRKLCVGMAMCGNSKVVMLDEPTAGMDPSARRALWDLIQKQKEGRSILLTTHFMDEADLLGDRIAIMAGGELQCCGSSFFLKKKYGAGYHLIMDKSAECDPFKVTQLLRKHIPTIEVHSNIGSELTYLLVEDQASVFQTMLRDLEEHSDSLGIRSYGISLTTLEEVFMKVGADHGQEESYNDLQGPVANGYMGKFKEWFRTKMGAVVIEENSSGSTETKLTMGNHNQLLSGFRLIQNQFLAMFMKKILSSTRTWILQLIQLLMPVLFLIIAIVVTRNQNNTGDLPKLSLSLKSYDDPITLIENTADTRVTEIYDIYTDMLKSSKQDIEKVDSISDVMMNYTAKVPSTVRMRYIVGASFKGPEPAAGGGAFNPLATVTAWFNNDPLHSPPLALGMALSTVYKYMLNKRIRFATHPLPFSANTKIQQLLQGNSMGFQVAFNMAFSMAFVSSFYVLFYVRERVCKSKHLQFVSGVKVYVFWITSFVCDLITFIVTALAIIITLACFQEDGFKTADDMGRMFLVLLYFGVAMIPMMYFASYLFDVPSTGFTRMTLFSVFSGVAGFMVVQVLGTPGLDLEYVADALHWIFLIVPHYSLATGVRDNYMTYATNKMCTYFVEVCSQQDNLSKDKCWDLACHTEDLADYCCVKGQDYFKWEAPGTGRNMFYSFIIGTGMFLLLLLMEYKWFSRIARSFRRGNKLPVPVPDEDSDVAEEKRMIRETSDMQLQSEYMMVLREVTKYYKSFLAVNGLSLGIKKYECFGLLGVNGAGKTTTFKMMTGDVKMSHGDAWVNRLNINTQLKEVQKNIGYCPQFDALLDDLTAKESLVMFALLRGIPRHECANLAKKLALDFDFHRHLNKQVKELSGGNKRKLSTAISLIGDPPVIYLDEPTTGMDPATKRYLWNALCQVRDNGKCIVLTSHSMEECEALCTRLAIMVNGHFKCLGSTQHLKNKFAEGYTLTIKIKKSYDHGDSHDHDTEQVEGFIKRNFPSSLLREKHQELLTFYIIDKTIPWSRMFGILETGKQEYNIEDYSLGQSSLEQVFLTFTKHQM